MTRTSVFILAILLNAAANIATKIGMNRVGGLLSGGNLLSKFLLYWVGRLYWFGPIKWAQRLFLHTPLVLAFIGESDVYHDRIWWNLQGRRIFETWTRESPWGMLFERN